MEDLILSILEFFGKAWWVEIQTESPKCTYYFGPFVRKREAERSKSGYVEDLEGEGAKITSLEIKRCKPAILTDDEEEEEEKSEKSPSFSGRQFKSFHE
jgi:hypothetical protein